MRIREIIYIVIISVLSVITVLSYMSARRSQEILRTEMAKIHEQYQKQFLVREQQQKEYADALYKYKKQQEEYSRVLEEWQRGNARCKQ